MSRRRRLWLGDWRISRHALHRALQRRALPEDILAAIARPTISRPGNDPGTEYRQRGTVAAVIDPAKRLIITVIVL